MFNVSDFFLGRDMVKNSSFLSNPAINPALTGFIRISDPAGDPARPLLKPFNGAVLGDSEGLRQVWPIFTKAKRRKNGQGFLFLSLLELEKIDIYVDYTINGR